MASVIQIGKKWRAQVRRKDHKPETRTFRTKKEADQWARALESGIDAGKGPALSASTRLGHLIAEYRRIRAEGSREIDPTTNTAYMLKHLEHDLGHERVCDLTPARLVKWASTRKAQGAGPYTINMELSCLGTTLRHAGSFLGVQVPDVAGLARPTLMHLQLIGGACAAPADRPRMNCRPCSPSSKRVTRWPLMQCGWRLSPACAGPSWCAS
jgi:hypothetical protein